ncbi:hypothetical protein UPYG_G00285650 [Umbra pygmaea]|uniref:Transmembrane protein 232 n=1 Tax=Umbra pygmaea TaxID=75934 RepID=A0ABD0WQ44_UMBPY
MPITKMPVVHLGIISQTYKQDLKKKKLKTGQEIPTHSNSFRNPFQITAHFIKKYTNSQGSEEQEKYVELARQLLCRSQCRAGLKCLGKGKHVDLPLAWTELLLLGLCHGKIQNDSLDSLLMSLDHSPVLVEHIPALFYLGESVLYWICTERSQKANLYTCEVKILKLGYLVFLRLFLHHISGNLSGYQKHKSSLQHFLKALHQWESRYNQFPNILLSVHVMLRVGEIICRLGRLEDDSPPITAPADCQEYKVNQVLWHCLLSWYCLHNNISQFSKVSEHLILLRDELQKDNWLDSALGLMVLGEAAKSNLSCLEMLLSLHISPTTHGILEENKDMSQRRCWPWQLEHVYTTVLADICQHSSTAEIQKTALLGSQTPQGCYNTDGLLQLLRNSDAEAWRLRYSAVQALVCVCRGLSGALIKEGLRNVAWIALQKHLSQETDQRVREGSRVIEAEINVPESVFCSEGGKPSPSFVANTPASIPGQLITWRIACTLSQLYLPPTIVHLNLWSKTRKDLPPSTRPRLKPSCLKPTETIPGPAKKTRVSTQIPRGMSKCCKWQKELQMKLAEEEDSEKGKLESVQKDTATFQTDHEEADGSVQIGH